MRRKNATPRSKLDATAHRRHARGQIIPRISTDSPLPLPSPLHRLARQAYGHAVLLLTVTAALWGANGVASRMAVGHVSPMTIVLFRWVAVFVVLALLLRDDLRRESAALRANATRIFLMALTGFTGFTVFFYLAGYHTTAVNITLLQSSIPPMVLIGAALFKGVRPTPMQIAGLAVTFVGVLLIATHGDPRRIAELAFNRGDVMLLVGCALYAGYTLALRDRPQMPALVFFTALAAAACISSLPMFIAEFAMGLSYWPTLKGWLILLFVALGPSLTSQVFFMRGVELIGPGRAGLFSNLVPMFGALFAVLLLGEEFHFYHGVALALGLAGVWLSERKA